MNETKKKGSDLWRRLVVAFIAVPILLALAFYAPNWGLWLLLSSASAIGTHEYYKMALGHVDFGGKIGILAGFAILGVVYWFDDPHAHYAVVSGSVLAIFLTLLWRVKEIEHAAEEIGHTFAGIAYTTVLFGGLILLCADTPRTETGPYQAGWLLFPMFVIWSGDTGAYFAGRAFGKHKLAPRISPKKTWEGAIGGTLASVLGGFAANALFELGPNVQLWEIVLLAFPGSVLGQMGDLAESLIKRSTGVKDSGTILYGHGGMLDRVDALIFAAPYFALVKWLADI